MKGYDLPKAELSKKQIATISKRLPIHTQQLRIFKYLATNYSVKTGVLCAKTSTVNLSHVTQVSLNPKLEPFGLVAACERPEFTHTNQFDETTAEHNWSLYVINQEALNQLTV